MAPSFSTDEKQTLLELARASIRYGIAHHRPLPIAQWNKEHAPAESLMQLRASFVTLQMHGDLRGCIGSLVAHRPLLEDVAENAYNAAFRDPRFDPVSASEEPQLHLHISVLSPPQPMQFTDEQDLLRQIRPGIDGLILEAPGHRGTFLPSVWESLPEPWMFLVHLKIKAGLPEDFWSPQIRVSRYTAEDVQ